MRRFAMAAVLVAAAGAAQAQQCPTGSYLWTDQWGNRVCKRFGDGGTAIIQRAPGAPGGCPVGTQPARDQWGTVTCKSVGGGPTYYDTSQGCPPGTYAWRDTWGNSVCKRF